MFAGVQNGVLGLHASCSLKRIEPFKRNSSAIFPQDQPVDRFSWFPSKTSSAPQHQRGSGTCVGAGREGIAQNREAQRLRGVPSCLRSRSLERTCVRQRIQNRTRLHLSWAVTLSTIGTCKNVVMTDGIRSVWCGFEVSNGWIAVAPRRIATKGHHFKNKGCGRHRSQQSCHRGVATCR